MSYATVFAALAAVLALYWITRRRSSVRTIVGPPSPSWIFGRCRVHPEVPERPHDDCRGCRKHVAAAAFATVWRLRIQMEKTVRVCVHDKGVFRGTSFKDFPVHRAF